MSLLPAKNLLDGSKTPATTTSEMKSAMGTLRDWLAELLGVDSADKAAARAQLGAASVVANILTKSIAGAVPVTLTDAEALNDILVFTGVITADISVIVPSTAKSWTVKNNTTGAFSVTVKTVAGAGVMVGQNKSQPVYCDATDVLPGMTDFVVPSSTPPTRQTVLGGVTNAAGYANMLAAGAGLALNLSATAVPMRTAFAQGALDFVATLSANATGVVTVPANNLSFITQDYVSPTSVTWGSTLAPRQEGEKYNQSAQSVLQFGGAAGVTTFLDDFGIAWTAQGAAKVQTNQIKFGAGALGGGGASNALNGSSDYVATPNITTLGNGSWSMRCWAYFTSLAATNSGVMGVNNSAGRGIWLSINTNKTVLNASSNGTSFDIASGSSGVATLVVNTWYFIEITYDAVAGKYFIYVNGVLDQTITSALKVCSVTTATVGAANSQNVIYYTTGYIDKFEFLPYCQHPNGTTYTPPIAAPNVATQGYACDWENKSNDTVNQVSGPSTGAGINPTFIAKNRVYCAEAMAGATTISSVVNYAFKGKFYQRLVNILSVSQRILVTPNLGSAKVKAQVNLINKTAEFGYSPGMVIPYVTDSNPGTYHIAFSPLQILDRNTFGIASNNFAVAAGMTPANAATTFTALTTANWDVEIIGEKA